jgi:anti-sigma regulatory factor (Ser/Thr protein kinase)
MEPQKREVIPSAKRLIKSLRDLGYTFSSAISDLIDNSIQAGATEIHIDAELKGVNSFIRIADNGYGMTLSQLEEAMRYGAENEYNIVNNLGKFGLGMKLPHLVSVGDFQ